jgi:uncharacterized membrane protein YdjX (TVP38/TMEM64 family)
MTARRILALAGFPLLLAAVIVPAIVFHSEIWRVFSSVRELQQWVRASGALAPLVFVAVQAVQVIVFIVPGEIPQIAGGYLFGVLTGTLLSLAGILAGSTAAFFLARMLGVPFVHALFRPERIQRIERLLASRGSRVVFFLLFLIPGIPKDILCYAAGLTPIGFPFFILASFAGRLPGILGSALIGDAAAGRRWLLVGIVSGAALLLFAAGFLLRPRIERWLDGMAERRGKTPAAGPPEEPPRKPG